MYALSFSSPSFKKVFFILLGSLFFKKRFTIHKKNVIMLCDMVFYKVLIKTCHQHESKLVRRDPWNNNTKTPKQKKA